MVPSLLEEQRLSLTALAREQGVSVPTVWRWTQRGIRGVLLETFHLGGRRYTTSEAFTRWVEATQVAQPGAMRPRTARQREMAIQRAEAELDAAGI